MTNGKLLRGLRRVRRIKQQVVASKAGISPATLRRVENDDPRALPETIAAVAQALDTTYDWVKGRVLIPRDCTREQLIAAGTSAEPDQAPDELQKVLTDLKKSGVTTDEIAVVISKAFNLKAIASGKKRHT